MKTQKIRIAILAVIALLIAFIGGTYAYWFFTKSQQTDNLVSSACLDILLDNESEAISLGNQFPISDEEGMQTTPYTFTVTNNCNTSIDYQVALESLGDKSTALKAFSLKVALDDNIKLYSNYSEVTPIINGAYESRSIGYAKLAPSGSEGSSVTHSLRIWIDYDAPVSEMNKTFESKISVTVGQNVVSPYEEGTLAYDILKNNGGAGVSVIDATELADRIASESNVYVGATRSYYYGTTYTYDATTSKYVLGGDVIQAKLSECRDGSKVCGKYTTKSASTSSETLYEITNLTSTEGTNYITAYTREYVTPFSTPTTIYDVGLYKTQDDLGDSYYFRGNVTNNYIQFGAYEANKTVNNITYNEATPIYWRIVRINGDGTIRLVYDGTEKVHNGTSHTISIEYSMYNSIDNLNPNFEDSDIRYILEDWYMLHLETKYNRYIADGIFCNDKEVTGYYYWDESWNSTTENNATHTTKRYAAQDRLYTTKKPKLTCTRTEDRYTTTAELGNGLLDYPIGLITADEMVFAGASVSRSNNKFYLSAQQSFWTSSIASSGEQVDGTIIFGMSPNDSFTDGELSYDSRGIRPVINLRADVEFTGDGSFENPYVITAN